MQFAFCCGPCAEKPKVFSWIAKKNLKLSRTQEKIGYLKNTQKNPKFGRGRQVLTRELGWEFPGWDFVSLCQIWDFYRYSLNVLKYPIMAISFFFLWETRQFEKWSLRGWRFFPVFPRAFDFSRANHGPWIIECYKEIAEITDLSGWQCTSQCTC